MNRTIFFVWIVVLSLISQVAQAALPTISTDDNEVWYFLKFTQGDAVVSSNGDGKGCKSAAPRVTGSQLWKVEGNATDGYTFTNKLGLSLTYTGTSQGDYVQAKTGATTNNLFAIVESGSNVKICPKGNTGQSLNSWGGFSAGSDIRLYSSSDKNAPMQFVPEETYKGVAQLPIIPYPAKLTKGNDTLQLKDLTTYKPIVSTLAATDSINGIIKQFVADLNAASGITLNENGTGKAITFTVNDGLAREAYNLTVGTDGINVEANSYAGFLYALTTIRQMLPIEIFTGKNNPSADWLLPTVTIEDQPEMPVRGFMLDVARHFFTIDEVKKIIDAAAVYKLNRFHWHLTDDQGWRIEIPEYPKLTSVGAIRKSSLTLNAIGSDNFFDDTEYGRGCFYTLDELRDVVNYAKERNVEILPEVDLPGHMVAAIASYPWLSCDSTQAYNDSYQPLGTPKEVRVNSGVSRDVLNVADPRVMSFLKTVLGHVAKVFPYPYIHIGGDECPTNAWDATPSYKSWMKDNGLSTTHDIQPWLVEQLGTWLRDSCNKNVVVWNELVVKGYWKSNYTVKPVVFSYSNNTQNGDSRNVVTQVTEKGFRTIATTTTPMYFDLLQASVNDMEFDAPYCGGYGDGWVNTAQSVYSYNPAGLAGNNANLVIGTQGTLWTESCTSGKEAEYELFPRLLAVSEVGWLPYSSRINYANFSNRLQESRAILDVKDIYYAPYAFDAIERTPAEAALYTADTLLAESRPGEVGHPSQEAYDALKAATEALRAETSNATLVNDLNSQIAAYKAADIKMPEAGSIYEIVSASTYYKKRYNGATVYANGNGMKIHYTPQTEPEEVFTFTAAPNGGYYVKSIFNGKNILLSGNNASLSASDSTAILIRKATKANAKYDYVPGVLNLRGGNGVLYAQPSGVLNVGTDSTINYAGSWRIREITDYTHQLAGLIWKCQLIIVKAKPGESGEPTQEALDFLQSEVITPGGADVESGKVTKDTYYKYVELYRQYTQYGKTSVIDALSETHYYHIRNAWPSFSGYYAWADATSNEVKPKTLGNTDNYKWSIRKNSDGTVVLINKGTNSAAYVDNNGDAQTVKVGKRYDWTLQELTVENNNTGVGIYESSLTNCWYTNPNGFSTIILKPNWGGCIWTFEKLSEEIPTAISSLQANHTTDQAIYDLQGRCVTTPQAHGLYIQGGKKIIR